MGAKKSISNSFTVNTVEDGNTLTVKSAIHSVGIRCTSDGKSDGSGSSAGLVTLYIDGVAVPTTHLSIKSQPSGLTVLTNTQQSAIPEGGVYISWANNVDMANLEGEVVLTVSYNSYSTEFSIPIICAKDGTDGKTYALKLTLPSLVIPCDSSGNSKSSGNKDCYVTFYVDGMAISTSSMTIAILSKPSGLTVQTNADVSQISKNRIYITYGSNVAKSTLEGVITFSVSDGTNTTYGGIAVMCSQDGSQGERGKIGRFYYYSGFDWDASNTTNKFVVNDAQVPFFSKAGSNSNQYYVFNRKETPSGGEMTMAQMATETSVGGQIQWNKTPWKIMTDDFKYLITEAIFAQFAHLGSFIISGDYFISQYGTLFYNNNGTIETTVIDASNVSTLFGGSVAYAWFADSDPMVDTTPTTGNYKFRPTKCIDALSGEEWMAGGNVHVSRDGDVQITGALMCSRIVRTIPSASTFNMFTGNTAETLRLKSDYLLLYGLYSSDAKIQLPPAKFFKGAKVKIINGTTSNGSPDPSVIKFSVYHSSSTEANVEDANLQSLNSMAVSAPIINGLTHNLFPYDYYTEITIEGYTSIELMSAPNFYHQDNSPYYVWMVVDGRELQ